MRRRILPYESGPYTPAQGARQGDRFLQSLQRLRGWRRGLATLASLAAVLVIVLLLAAGAARLF